MKTTVADLYQQLDPMRALRADDEADIALYVDWQRELGARDIKLRLAQSMVRHNSQAPAHLFTGPRGSGKTTELSRMRRMLERGTFGEKFFVSTLMAAEWLDLTDVRPEELALQIIRQLIADLSEAGFDLGEAQRRYAQRLGTELSELVPDAAVQKVDSLIPAFRLQNVPYDQRWEYRNFLRSRLPGTFDVVNDQIIAPAREWLRRAKNIGGILVIVDELDRIPLLGSNLENLFIYEAGTLRALDCNLVYTIPLELIFSPNRRALREIYLDEAVALSAIPVLDPAGGTDPFGQRTLREVLGRRLHAAGLNLPELFEGEELLSEVLLASGGHVRSLFVLLRSMLDRIEQLPISRSIVEQTLRRLAADLARPLSNRDRAALAAVHATKSLLYDNDGERWDHLLRDAYVLSYQRGNASFCDSHPLLQYADASFFGTTVDPRPPEPNEVLQEISVGVYLDSDDPSTAERILRCVDEFVDLLGYDGPIRPVIEHGSFVRRSLAKIKVALTSDEVRDLIAKAERAVEVRILDSEQADVDYKMAAAVSNIIAALADAPNACIQIGSILFIKYSGPQGSVVLSKNLSLKEIKTLERFPGIQKEPHNVLEYLAVAQESLTDP
jgi:hypothetical protein